MGSAGVGEHVVMPLDPFVDYPLVTVHHWAAQVLHPLIHQALAAIILQASDENDLEWFTHLRVDSVPEQS